MNTHCATRQSHWPRLVCGWYSFSRVLHVETKTKDNWISFVGFSVERERKSLVYLFIFSWTFSSLASSSYVYPWLVHRAPFIVFFGFRLPSPALEILPQLGVCVIERLMKRQTESNISRVTGRPLLVASTSIWAGILAWINLCSDRSCVISSPTSTLPWNNFWSATLLFAAIRPY